MMKRAVIKKLLKNGKVLTILNSEPEKSKETVKQYEEFKDIETECLHDNAIVLYWYSTDFHQKLFPYICRKIR